MNGLSFPPVSHTARARFRGWEAPSAAVSFVIGAAVHLHGLVGVDSVEPAVVVILWFAIGNAVIVFRQLLRDMQRRDRASRFAVAWWAYAVACVTFVYAMLTFIVVMLVPGTTAGESNGVSRPVSAEEFARIMQAFGAHTMFFAVLPFLYFLFRPETSTPGSRGKPEDG